jgi:uncharacterized repeat protein (TIGR01451 family)
MKNKKIISLLLLTGVLLLIPLTVFACGKKSTEETTAPIDTEPEGVVASTPLTVLSIVGGDVFVMSPEDNDWVPGKVNMSLDVNSRIKTGDGKAALTFFEGSTIELEANTEISLVELGMSGTVSTIKLKQILGNSISRVEKLIDPASKYEIETPACVAAVRGSSMFVGVSEDGKTVVGNIEGLISAFAQGVEVEIPVNNHVTVVPGNSPSEPESGIIPEPPAPEPAEIIGITIVDEADRASAFPGDKINYTYVLTDIGNVPLTGISVTDTLAGEPVYQSGDSNANQVLEIGESWVYTNSYITKTTDVGQFTNIATVAGVSPGNQQAGSSATAVVVIEEIRVEITSPKESGTPDSVVTLAGSINDPSISKVVVDVNGISFSTVVIGGQFSCLVNLSPGENIITVTAVKTEDITASATIEIVWIIIIPEEPEIPN